MFDKYKYNGAFQLLVDATGIPSHDYNLNNNCIVKKSKNGTIKISEMSDTHLERAINYIKGLKSCEAGNMDDLVKVLLMEIELLKRKIKDKDNEK